MPEYLSPGVYVEEIDTGSKPIEGVSTSTTGMVGISERGPVNVPILVTSYGEFRRWFGDRLDINVFSNALGAHCYLPYAVEGFFRNGGKRLYVTRVLPQAATHAAVFLFDRGEEGSADTLILRAAGEQSGTAANLPLLYPMDISDLSDTPPDNWIRIGDGSTAEYRQITALGTVANNTHIPLGFPLGQSHASGVTVEQFPRTSDAGLGLTYSAAFTLATDTEVGDRSIEVSGANADITALIASADQLLEIGAAGAVEYRIVQEVTQLASDRARVRLESALVFGYDSATAVTPLQVPAAAATANLALEADAGDGLLFVDDRGGAFDTLNDLLILDAGGASPEVRRIGELSSLALSTGAYEDYPAAGLVQEVTLGDDDRSLTAAAAVGDTTVTLDDTSALGAGDTLLVDVNANQETMTIRSVNTAANQVTFTTALTIAHAAGTAVVPADKSLTANAAAGSRVIALDNRLGLSVGDVIRIGESPNDEYMAISAIPNPSPRGVAPNAGNVVLDHPLQRSFTSGTEVRRQHTPAVVAMQPTVLVLEAEEDGDELLVSDGTGYAQNDIVRITTPTNEEFYHRTSQNATALASVAEATLGQALDRAHPAGSALVGRNRLIEVQALDAGAWGNRLRIAVQDETTGLVSRTTVTARVNATTIRLASAAGLEPGTVLELLDPADHSPVGDPVKVDAVARTADYTVTLATPGMSAQQTAVFNNRGLEARSREFQLSVYLLRQPDPAMPTRDDTVIASETFRHLSMDPRHPRYLETIIGAIGGALRLSDRRPEGASEYIRVRDLNPSQALRLGAEALVDILPTGVQRPARHQVEHGDDSILTLSDNTYIGSDAADPENRTGLHTLRNVEEISLVAIPGQFRAAIQQALINHCETMRYRFAVMDGPPPPNDSLNDVQVQRQQFDTKYAALYYPWLLIQEPFPANLAQIRDFPIPPSGHTLGIYARTDIERGVHKAPANEVVRGIRGLQRSLSKGEHDILNPSPVNINVIRDFRRNNRGIRVWGGRVITSDTDWKYVNVRRLLIFIEHSIDRGLQWVVFEPNAEPLWARVRRTISNFLTVVWRNGALEGTKPEEAFFVKCDRTTMTQTDIDNGRLICVIGVAPVKPAEFVIIRIGLWTAHAED